MYSALHTDKRRLEHALKRSRLYDPSVPMVDTNKLHVENFDLEKRPRKFNSWVAKRAIE